MSVHAPSAYKDKIYRAEMKTFFLSPTVLILFGLIYVLAETNKGAVYHISPTEPLSSCPGNSSCPPGQLCHTMDYLANQSSEFFSPDQVNVILIFMCGVHNYTNNLFIRNLHSFIMKGAAESRENVIIDHQFGMKGSKPKCTLIQFFNVSFVNIITLTMRCPAIKLKVSHITVKSSTLYGYPGMNETLSFINITGRGSQALLDNCTFKENCFIRSYLSDGIIVSNSTFHSYRHRLHSIIAALSSVVTLAGNVNFTNGTIVIHSSSGTALYLKATHPEVKSSLNITTGATVYFVNLTCKGGGGAVQGRGAMMHIDTKATVIFKYNTAGDHGGAVSMRDGMIIIGTDSFVIFMYNHANFGGAITLASAILIINSEANLIFSHNYATSNGGALKSVNSTAHVNTSGIIFYDNRAPYGGAINSFYGIMIININKSVNFTMNSAQVKGGAINIEIGVHPAIIVIVIIPNYSFSTTLHFKEVLSIVACHHYSWPQWDISRVFSL